MKKMTSTDVLEKFLKTEYDYQMFDKTCSGVKIWQYVRTFVYPVVLNKLLGINSTQTSISNIRPHDEVLKTLHGWFEYKVKRNIFFANNRDVLIFSSPFRVEDGEFYYRDIHTSRIDDGLSLSHYVLDRRVAPTSIVLSKSKNMLTFDIEKFEYVYGVEKNNKANKHELECYFLQPIEREFGIVFSLKERKKIFNFANSRVFWNESFTKYCKYLIKKIKPKAILFVCLADLINQIVCVVAGELNIPTIELQHGTIFEFIPYYFYKPSETKLSGFPDYFFSYGDYEKEISRMPIPQNHIVSVGSPEIENRLICPSETYNSDKKKKIVFISSFFKETAEVARQLSFLLDDEKYEVVYKLHPKEILTWEGKMGYLFKDTKIKVIDELDSIHNYLKDADWVVGTASTGLFEATCYKHVKIAYINNYGAIDHPLISKGKAVPVYTAFELQKTIEEDSFSSNKDYDFYKLNSMANINREIERIIASL